MLAKILIIPLIGVVVLFLLAPALLRCGTRAFAGSEPIILPDGDPARTGAGRSVHLVTLLGFDAIPAISNPQFVTAIEAEDWMEPTEQVLGLSINGDHRAYSIRMLSRHEIVNDVVGGVPVAVTW